MSAKKKATATRRRPAAAPDRDAALSRLGHAQATLDLFIALIEATDPAMGDLAGALGTDADTPLSVLCGLQKQLQAVRGELDPVQS